jgi:ABC-type uncharacterized transport system permease subunit
MSTGLTSSLNQLLDTVTAGPLRVPGVVAAITGRDGLVYEGASGQRTLGQVGEMAFFLVIHQGSVASPIEWSCVHLRL